MSKTDPFAAPKRIYPSKKVNETEVPETQEQETEVPSGTISEIKEWIGDDLDRAQKALEAERASEHPRVTLVEYLEDKVDA